MFLIFYLVLLEYSIVTAFLSSLSSSKTSHTLLLALFQIHAHFSINCFWIHISICIYIPNYNLLSLFNVPWMHVFRADHLACWSLGKTISPTHSRAQLPIIFVYDWGLRNFPLSTLACPLMSFWFCSTFGQSHWWDFMCLTSDSTRRHNLTANSLIFWLLQSSCPHFLIIPWALGMRLFKDGAVGLCDFAFRLCFSVQVSSGALRSLPDGWWRPHLPGYKNSV